VRFLFVIALAGACGDGDAPDPVGSGSLASLELGTGRTTFVPLQAGAPIELVHGPQGGYHLDLTLRLWSDAPEGVILDYEVRRAGEVALVSVSTQYVVEEARLLREGDHWLRLGDRAILAIADPADLVGDAVEILVRGNAGSGEAASDMRAATVVDDEI
jgi:hypothetical protein